MRLRVELPFALATTRRALRLGLAVCCVIGSLGVIAAGLPGSVAVGAEPRITPTLQWSQTLDDAGSPVALSSPDVADFPGGPAVVVGDRAGYVYAFYLASGSPVAGWPFPTGGVPVDSTPSVDPDDDSVLVGVGDSITPAEGAYQSITPGGGNKWYRQVQDPSTDPTPAYAVQASMAVGDLQGQTDTVAGTLGEAQDAMNAADGSVLNGFPWFQADSDFSTPALADLYSNGTTEIIEGGDSTAGLAYGTQYSNGGHLRVLSPTGNAGTGNPAGGLDCEYDSDQVVQSSPAVGAFLPGGAEGIVVGTGTYWPGATTTDQLLALNDQCQIQWADVMDGATTSSPALADFLGNGQLQVAEGTDNGSGGSVYVIAGSGQIVWHAPAVGRLIGSVVSADLTGSGHQDVIAATTGGVEIFDGATGAVLGVFAQGIGFQNSPLVTHDANGTLGITVAGYDANNAGTVEHFEVPGSNGSLADEPGAWPMFHHDPQLTGNAGSTPASPPPPACNPNDRAEPSPAVASAAAASRAIPTTGLGYTPLAAPVRIADTRAGATDPSTYAGDTLCPGGTLTIDVPAADVPSGAAAIVAQLSAVSPSSAGFLSVYPAGTTAPSTSNVNFVGGQDVGNLVTVGLGTDPKTGSLAVTVLNGPASGGPDTDLTLDLYGYYAPHTASSGSSYVALTPARIFDTRAGSGEPGAGATLTNGGSVQVPVLGHGGVPATGVSAVVVNIGVTDTSAPSFVYAYPTGSPPSSSTPTVNQNWVPGETLSTKAIVGVGSGGSITVANHDGDVDVVVDVDGYFPAPATTGAFLNVLSTPVRLLDTRPAGVGGGQSATVGVAGARGVPSTATAGVLDVVDLATSGNFLTVYPAGQPVPFAADADYVSGDTDSAVANASYATIGSGGDVDVYNGPATTSAANIVVDEFGYFAPAG